MATIFEKGSYNNFVRPPKSDDSATIARIADQARKAAGLDQSFIKKTILAIRNSQFNRHVQYTTRGWEAYKTDGPDLKRKYADNLTATVNTGKLYPVIWVPDPRNPTEPPVDTAKPTPTPSPTLPEPVTPTPQPAKPQPAKPQPAKPQPAKPQPAKPQPAKPQPAKPQPAKPQPAKPQPAKPQPSKPGLPIVIDPGPVQVPIPAPTGTQIDVGPIQIGPPGPIAPPETSIEIGPPGPIAPPDQPDQEQPDQEQESNLETMPSYTEMPQPAQTPQKTGESGLMDLLVFPIGGLIATFFK